MSRTRTTIAALGLTVLLGAPPFAIAQSPAKSSTRPLAIDTSKVVDLTYNFDDTTIYWPTAKSFEWHKESWGISPGGYWYAAARYAASEHGGTHIDSPIHFGQGKTTADEIPVFHLIGPAVVIDVSAACEKDSDYRLRVADIESWEKQYGRIPDGAIVLVHSGWGKFWPDKKRYLGSDTPGDTAHLHFSGFSKEVAEFLVTQRKVSGVGIDTASMDCGQSKDFIAHQSSMGQTSSVWRMWLISRECQASGATLIALPMKIKGGTGAPARIIAILP